MCYLNIQKLNFFMKMNPTGNLLGYEQIKFVLVLLGKPFQNSEDAVSSAT